MQPGPKESQSSTPSRSSVRGESSGNAPDLDTAWENLLIHCNQHVRAECVDQMMKRIGFALEKLYVTGDHSEFRDLIESYWTVLSRFVPPTTSTATDAVDVTLAAVSLPGDRYGLMEAAEPRAYKQHLLDSRLEKEALAEEDRRRQKHELNTEYATVVSDLEEMKDKENPLYEPLIKISEKQLKRIAEELENLLVPKPTQEGIDQQRVMEDVAVPLTELKKLIDLLISLRTALMRPRGRSNGFNSELRSTASTRPSKVSSRDQTGFEIKVDVRYVNLNYGTQSIIRVIDGDNVTTSVFHEVTYDVCEVFHFRWWRNGRVSGAPLPNQDRLSSEHLPLFAVAWHQYKEEVNNGRFATFFATSSVSALDLSNPSPGVVLRKFTVSCDAETVTFTCVNENNPREEQSASLRVGSTASCGSHRTPLSPSSKGANSRGATPNGTAPPPPPGHNKAVDCAESSAPSTLPASFSAAQAIILHNPSLEQLKALCKQHRITAERCCKWMGYAKGTHKWRYVDKAYEKRYESWRWPDLCRSLREHLFPAKPMPPPDGPAPEDLLHPPVPLSADPAQPEGGNEALAERETIARQEVTAAEAAARLDVVASANVCSQIVDLVKEEESARAFVEVDEEPEFICIIRIVPHTTTSEKRDDLETDEDLARLSLEEDEEVQWGRFLREVQKQHVIDNQREAAQQEQAAVRIQSLVRRKQASGIVARLEECRGFSTYETSIRKNIANDEETAAATLEDISNKLKDMVASHPQQLADLVDAQDQKRLTFDKEESDGPGGEGGGEGGGEDPGNTTTPHVFSSPPAEGEGGDVGPGGEGGGEDPGNTTTPHVLESVEEAEDKKKGPKSEELIRVLLVDC